MNIIDYTPGDISLIIRRLYPYNCLYSDAANAIEVILIYLSKYLKNKNNKLEIITALYRLPINNITKLMIENMNRIDPLGISPEIKFVVYEYLTAEIVESGLNKYPGMLCLDHIRNAIESDVEMKELIACLLKY